jgi:predicted O-methyltransferase YrrM
MDKARSYNPTTVFEIGSDKGGGLYHWCQCLPSVKQVIACEIRGTPYRDLFETHFPHIKFLWLDGVSSYSLETINQVDNWLAGDDIDCLFIDGDKGAFEKDFDVYLPYMAKEKSVVFMHDINDQVPNDQYQSVRERGFPGETFIDTLDSLEAVNREELGLPIANSHEAWLRYWKGDSCGVGTIYLSDRKKQ